MELSCQGREGYKLNLRVRQRLIPQGQEAPEAIVRVLVFSLEEWEALGPASSFLLPSCSSREDTPFCFALKFYFHPH